MAIETKQMTEEQKKKLWSLHCSTMRKQCLIGLKTCGLLFLANIFVILIGLLLLQSQIFIVVGSMLNAIFILPSLGRETRKERDRIKEEVKKILEN